MPRSKLSGRHGADGRRVLHHVIAIDHGRGLHDNILRFLLSLLGANAGEALIFAVAVTTGLGAPLTVLQILVVNLLSDSPSAVTLGADPPDGDVVRRLPRPLSEGLIEPMGGRLRWARRRSWRSRSAGSATRPRRRRWPSPRWCSASWPT
jgi:hypothetical protein